MRGFFLKTLYNKGMRFLILIISSLLLLFTNFGVTSFSPDTNVLDNQRLSEKTTLNKKYKKALENEQPYILPNEYCKILCNFTMG